MPAELYQLHRNINIIQRFMRKQMNQKLKKYKLNDSNYYIILEVVRHPGITEEELSHMLYRDRSLVTKAVNHLVDQNWIKIDTDSDDHRRHRLQPSKSARRNYHNLLQIMIDVNQETVAHLSLSNQATLISELGLISRHIMDDKDSEIKLL